MEDGEEVGDGEPGTASGDDDGEDGEAEAEAGEDGEGAAAGGAGAGRAGEEEETDVSVTGRIFCRNLPFTATEDVRAPPVLSQTSQHLTIISAIFLPSLLLLHQNSPVCSFPLFCHLN